MYPTRRAVFLFALGVPLVLGFMVLSRGYDALWTVTPVYISTCMLLMGIDGILSPNRRDLRVDRKLPGALYLTDRNKATFTLSFETKQNFRCPVEVLAETDDRLAPLASQVVGVRMGTPTEVEMELQPKRRGEARVERIWLRWSGPLNLVWRQRVDTVDTAIPVLPNVPSVRRLALRMLSQHGFVGSKVQNFYGDGSEFECLREYVRGLDRRSIDWKASARHGNLICKQFRAERNHQIVLCMDSGRLMCEEIDHAPKIDHAIEAVLLTGFMALQTGDRVGAYTFDARQRGYLSPSRSPGYFNKLQRFLAGVDYSTEETNFTLGIASLSARLHQRSLVILVTDFVDTITADLMVNSLRRLSAKHMVLFVALEDPLLTHTSGDEPRNMDVLVRAVVASELERERRRVFVELGRLGIQCLQTSADKLGPELINRYLAIKHREMV